ncbi:Ppx/GppA phosphatase family protein [Roseibium suaedae]
MGAKAALARKGGRRPDPSANTRYGSQAVSGHQAPLDPSFSGAEQIQPSAGMDHHEEGRSGGRRRGRRRKVDPARGHSAAGSRPALEGGVSETGASVADNQAAAVQSDHFQPGNVQPDPGHDTRGFPARLPSAPYAGARSHSSRSGPLYAALDLGTNNCRLLIARPEERGFRVVDAYSRIVRLGEGVGASRRLGEPAMERAIEALANCHRKLLERGVERSRLIATEACRAAENGDEFIARVKSETGLALEVVNRETEARLAVAGCVSLVDQDAEGVILFDIGGGSSEIVWLDLRNRCGARGFALTRFIRAWTSLPVGVVNLAERHGGVDVTHEVFEAMVADVASHLQTFDLGDELTAAIAGGGVHMLGTSGTVTTLAGVHLGLKRYDRRRVDGAWLENDQVSAMIDHLREMPYDQRVENPCIGADRADLVLAGCAILEAIRRRWSCSRLRVADRGLREGILTELMAADGVWSRRTGPRRPSRQRGRK